MSDVPVVKPINITEYEFKQSKYEHVPKLPFRSIIVASSTGCKTVVVQNLLFMFIEIQLQEYLYSASVHNDRTFTEVQKYIRDELHVDDAKEQVYFDNYNPNDLENVIERQKKIISYMKSKKIKNYIQY